MIEDVRQLDRREWMAVVVVAVLVTGLLQTPYWLGYTWARPGTAFTGILMNPEDTQSYFAKMLQGYEGAWLYTIPFTTEDHSPAFVGGFYLLLGHVARGLGLSLDTMWHVARIVADLLLFITTFAFVAMFLGERRVRWTAYLLALFGSGLGWVLFLLNQTDWLGAFPVDFKMPEAHLFFTALTFPHVAFGVVLIIVSAVAIMGMSQSFWWAIVAGIVNLALAIAYPFLIYLVLVIGILYFTVLVYRAKRFLWRDAIRFVIAYSIPAPLVLYYAATLASNPVYHAWDAQSITLSPPIPHYLVAYGVMLWLALVAHKRSAHSILWVWGIAAALLVYAPLNPQRRFVEGVHVPLAILATAGWFDFVLPRLAQTQIFQTIARRPRYSVAGLERLLTAAFLAGMSLSNVYIIASVCVTTTIQQPYPLFRSRDEIAGVEWLRANTARTDIVLSAYETGNYIAAHAGNRVVIGHWAETVDWERKMKEVDRFYSATTDDGWRIALLREYRIAYVFWGKAERDLGAFDPSRADYLQSVFANNTVIIYRVVP
jgi:hypothetical protein